jgi:hypothetical protein
MLELQPAVATAAAMMPSMLSILLLFMIVCIDRSLFGCAVFARAAELIPYF